MSELPGNYFTISILKSIEGNMIIKMWGKVFQQKNYNHRFYLFGREISHLLFRAANAYNNQGWSRLKPTSQELIRISHMEQ